jgi:hypothetical protein
MLGCCLVFGARSVFRTNKYDYMLLNGTILLDFGEISDSRGGENEDDCSLGCCAVKFVKSLLTF